MSLSSIRIFIKKLKLVFNENVSSVWDFFLFFLRIPPESVKPDIDKKLILYVGEFLPPRIARIAKWTKRLDNYSTILLCHKSGYFEEFSNEAIDHTLLFRNKWHLKRTIRSLPNLHVAHGFAPKSKSPYFAMKFLKKYQPVVPFVVDYQDVLTIYYGLNPVQKWLKKELPYEKLCLQNANGIFANSLEPLAGMNILGIRNSGKRLFFPLYCDNDSFTTSQIPLTKDNIHLVYVGGIVGSHRDKRYYAGTQFHWLIEYLTTQKIHFHVYPSPTVTKADYEEYEVIAKHNDFFHFHTAVPQADLSQELSQYHYGLMPFFAGTSEQSALKSKYATTLKLFNYLEAGIPIIVGASVIYQSWLVSRYKLGIIVTQKEDFMNIRTQIESQNYQEQLNNVIQQREVLSLKKHIPRLIEFYERLRASSLN